MCKEDYYPDVPMALGTISFFAERVKGRMIAIVILCVCMALHYLRH